MKPGFIDGLYVPRIPNKDEAGVMPARVKLQAVIGAERAIAPLLIAGFVVIAIAVFLGPGRKNTHLINGETPNLVAFGLGGVLAFSAMVIWLLVDNYYVLECPSGRIWLHKGLRFRGNETLFLEADDVAAVGLNCGIRRGRRGQTGWTYTPVFLTKKDGLEIELSKLETGMDCAELPEYNWRTRSWAAVLGCYWLECPPNSAFRVGDQFRLFSAFKAP